MARYLVCLVAASGGNPANYVLNTIEWDGVTPFALPAGTSVIADTANLYEPGDTYGEPPARTLVTTPAVPLKDQATAALASARTSVYNEYGILNAPTPDAWVTYLKALMAISSGTDTTSTTLPTQPTDVTTASTTASTTGSSTTGTGAG